MSAAAFLQAIRDNPADDTPRLVYADWLDEHGEAERAEFIRVQCRIADLDIELQSGEDCEHEHCEGCKERRLLCERQRELLASIGYYIVNTPQVWPISMTVPARRVAIRRGFVESWEMTWPDCRDHLDAIRAAQPVTRVRLITDVWLVGFDRQGDELLIQIDGCDVKRLPFPADMNPDFRAYGRLSGLLEIAPIVFRAYWPGIEFELPPIYMPNHPRDHRGRFRSTDAELLAPEES